MTDTTPEQIRSALVKACGDDDELAAAAYAALLQTRHPGHIRTTIAVLRDRAETYDAFAAELRSLAETVA